MATKTTGWKCTHSYSVVSSSNTSITIRVKCYWKNNGWNYQMGPISAWVYCGGSSYKVKSGGNIDTTDTSYGSYLMGSHDFVITRGTSAKKVSVYAKITSSSTYVSGTKSSTSETLTINAKPSYSVKYNANGGTGAPSTQTKWYGTKLTLSSTKPTRTGYSFSGWATSASGSVSYAAGSTYSSNAAITLYAVWKANTYTISYDLNGGSEGPSNQTKTHGVNLTLSSTIPKKENYNFLGWSTVLNGDIAYSPSDIFNVNSNTTLYAVWELAYTKPRIINFKAQRCDSNGLANENGKFIYTSFEWATDNPVIDIVAQWKTQSGNWRNKTIEASGIEGSVYEVIGDGFINTDTSYIFRVYVSDKEENGTTYSNQIPIGSVKYPIDIKRFGDGVAFGKSSELYNVADFAFSVKLGGGLTPIVLEPETDLNDVKTPNFYVGGSTENFNYINNPIDDDPLGTFHLDVISVGDEGQLKQKLTKSSKGESVTYQRFYYDDTWGDWINCYLGEELLYDNESGAEGTVTLSKSASQFTYLEVFFKDNNGHGNGYTKIYKPNGAVVDLSLIEGSSNILTYFRRTEYIISGTTMTPSSSKYGYCRISTATASHQSGTNYIRITRVVGRR